MGHSPDQILASKPKLPAPIAFVFPGQGSQSLGMLSEWAEAAILRSTFEEASEALGYDVWNLTQNGPEEKLNQTEVTQPVLLTASVALYRQWRELEKEMPALFAGHSLGEYSALVAAGALDFQEAVTLVAERGRFMQAAVPAGAGSMAAILGLSDEQVSLACEQAKASPNAKPNWVVSPANFNAPGQVVIAGLLEAVESAMICAKAIGAKRVIPLRVSVPSHCALMSEPAQKFGALLKQVAIRLPEVPVIHNVDAKVHLSVQEIETALVNQLTSSVRWVESIQNMAAKGVKTIVECGPGLVLTGLNKRIAPELNSISIQECLDRRGVECL